MTSSLAVVVKESLLYLFRKIIVFSVLWKSAVLESAYSTDTNMSKFLEQIIFLFSLNRNIHSFVFNHTLP